jgi:DNA modification methylase
MFGAIDCEHTARCDTGGSSRFFPTFEWEDADWFPLLYVPKPSRAERDAGCEDLPAATAGEITGGRKEGSAGLDNPRAGAGRTSGGRNTHATVKPIQLMRWLCRLVTPPGGICLDPFAGSGTTILAANLEGFRAIGFDLEEHHCEIARARIFHHVGGHYSKPERKAESDAEPVRKQLALFGATK